MDLQKNIDRIENMLFHICGCNKEEAALVLKTCLKELDMPEDKKKEIRKRRCKEYGRWLREI